MSSSGRGHRLRRGRHRPATGGAAITSDRWLRASWRQTTIDAVVAARPLERAADGSGRVLSYRVRTADRSLVELDAGAVCERLSNEHHELLLLTVDRAAHVLVRHMRGGLGGAFSPGTTLTDLLGLFCAHCHERLGYGEQSQKITVACDRVVGASGVASARELAARGVIGDEDLKRLAQLKEEVFATNVYGSAIDRAALVAGVNRQWRERNVRLLERNGVVLPAFIAPPQPTRSFVIVLDRPRGLGAVPDDEKRIRTIYPGEPLCDSPAHVRFMPLVSASDLPVGTTIAELQRKHDGGGALSEREQTVVRAHRDAFEVWYEHGPLVRAARAGARSRRPSTTRPRIAQQDATSATTT